MGMDPISKIMNEATDYASKGDVVISEINLEYKPVCPIKELVNIVANLSNPDIFKANIKPVLSIKFQAGTGLKKWLRRGE